MPRMTDLLEVSTISTGQKYEIEGYPGKPHCPKAHLDQPICVQCGAVLCHPGLLPGQLGGRAVAGTRRAAGGQPLPAVLRDVLDAPGPACGAMAMGEDPLLPPLGQAPPVPQHV